MIDLLLVGNLPHPSPLILYPTRTAYSGQSASDPPYHTFGEHDDVHYSDIFRALRYCPSNLAS